MNTCKTYSTSSGDHTVCRTCGEMWTTGRPTACETAGAVLAKAAGTAPDNPPLPPSPAEVGDLILQTREHVQALGWGNRERLYPEKAVRRLLDEAVAQERERMIADGWRQTRYVAPVTACEACLTPDACAIRGQCAHYLRERA